MKKKLTSAEVVLTGGWIEKNGQVVLDGTAKRIEYLTNNVLKKIATSDDGWDTVYSDPEDGRYWELIYPFSGTHGGGAPVLCNLSTEQAEKKYKIRTCPYHQG